MEKNRSTGPRTEKGKSMSSQNALKHGLTAKRKVVPGESEAEYQAFRKGLMDDLGPETQAEAVFAERIIDASWQLRRVEREEIRRLDSYVKRLEDAGRPGGVDERTPECLSDNERMLKDIRILNRYEASLERTLYKSMEILTKIRKVRMTSRAYRDQDAPAAKTVQ